jgi:chromosome segregation ATPase
MDEKPLTKSELMEALNSVIPPLATAIGALQKDVKEIKQDINVLKQDVNVLKQDMTEVKKELAKKPDEDKVRQIVRDELENAFTHDTFKLTPVRYSIKGV